MCSITGCGRISIARTYCRLHYNRWYTHKDPMYTVKDGRTRTREYHIWSAIKQRCLNKKNPRYHCYGGRGISLCERWMRFEDFLFDMGRRPSPAHSIDRLDNNKGYCKENCRWSTLSQQMNNTRRIHWVEYAGEKMSLSQVARKYGIKRITLSKRLENGWSIERAITERISVKV